VTWWPQEPLIKTSCILWPGASAKKASGYCDLEPLIKIICVLWPGASDWNSNNCLLWPGATVNKATAYRGLHLSLSAWSGDGDGSANEDAAPRNPWDGALSRARLSSGLLCHSPHPSPSTHTHTQPSYLTSTSLPKGSSVTATSPLNPTHTHFSSPTSHASPHTSPSHLSYEFLCHCPGPPPTPHTQPSPTYTIPCYLFPYCRRTTIHYRSTPKPNFHTHPSSPYTAPFSPLYTAFLFLAQTLFLFNTVPDNWFASVAWCDQPHCVYAMR
jgi:hypothetical protein